jgi:hypothetical protein
VAEDLTVPVLGVTPIVINTHYVSIPEVFHSPLKFADKQQLITDKIKTMHLPDISSNDVCEVRPPIGQGFDEVARSEVDGAHPRQWSEVSVLYRR